MLRRRTREAREKGCVCVVVEKGVRGEKAGLVGCFNSK